MPTKDSIKAIRAIQSLCPAKQIIAMSENVRRTSTNTLKLARRHGVAAIISKPLSETALAALLNDVFGPP